MNETETLAKLAPLLRIAIVEKVSSLKLAGPICCVRICYFDTHAPSTYLALRITTKPRRDTVLAEKGRDALFALWAPGEESHDAEVCLPDDSDPSARHAEIRRLFAAIYEMVSDDPDEHMLGFQQVLQRVARELNGQDWAGRCEVTDDFVIAPADASRFFGGDADYDDLVKGIPDGRLELLRARGLLGPGENWDQRPGFEYAGEGLSEEGKAWVAFEARVRAMPAPERVAYLIDQLTKMAHDDDSDMKRTNTAEGWPIDRLREIGPAGVVAALKLAAQLIEIDDSLAHDIVYKTVSMVRDANEPSEEVEVLLREILQKSDATGGGVPVNCAQTLHELFPKYPEPQFGYDGEGSRVFSNAQAYLQMPLGDVPKKPWWKFW